MQSHKYTYNGLVVGVFDGDTITVELDLGFSVKVRHKLRLLGIDTPELRGGERTEGLKVRDYVRDRILNRTILVKSHRDRTGKFGRYLATIYYGEQLTNLNDELLQLGYAKPYN